MRISDWSSDVCSSDLAEAGGVDNPQGNGFAYPRFDRRQLPTALGKIGRADLGELGNAIGFARSDELGPLYAEDGEAPACQSIDRIFVARSAPQEAPAAILDHDKRMALAGTMPRGQRSEEHTSELQSLMRISYAGFCLQK